MYKLYMDMVFCTDDDSVARDLASSVRVLVWVMTHPANLQLKAIHVNNTWAKRSVGNMNYVIFSVN